MLCNRIGMLKAGRIVALDSTRNLLENFSGLTLRLRLDRDATGPAAGFPKAEVDGERMVLNLSGFAEIESVLTRLRETGAVIREFDLQPPDLEDVFVRVMAGH